MTGVVIDSQSPHQALILGIARTKVLEERQRFGGIFKKPERLRLQAEMQLPPKLPTEIIDVMHTAAKIGLDGPHLLPRGDEVFERPRQRAHAPLYARRNKTHEQIEKPVGVVQSTRITPVWSVDILLHPSSMELAKRKSIDRENIASVLLQPALKSYEFVTLSQFSRSQITQAQPDVTISR